MVDNQIGVSAIAAGSLKLVLRRPLPSSGAVRFNVLYAPHPVNISVLIVLSNELMESKVPGLSLPDSSHPLPLKLVGFRHGTRGAT